MSGADPIGGYNVRMEPYLYVLAVLAALLLAVAFVYNRMVRLRNRVRRAWKDIDVQLRLRHDLVPVLVSVAEGYAAHESRMLERAAHLRSVARAAAGVRERGARELDLASSLAELFALGESYPDLKADEAFQRLFRESVTVENHLAAARKYYNGCVRAYNNFIQSFPQLILARLLRFRPSEYFQEGEGQDTPA